jgi:CIC family chloride channel protein
MPAIIASVTSYSTFMAFGGYGHRLLENTSGMAFSHPVELLAYVALGVACAVTSAIFYACLRAAAALRRKSRLPRWLAPAVAGLGCGVIACAFPQIMDSRYEFVQRALDLDLPPNPWLTWALLFALVLVAKCMATALMMGAESAGGLFGPVVFIGAVAGAMTGALLQWLLPSVFPASLRAALIPVGMAGVLSASLRTPLAAIVMVTEMTGTYGLIVPLMLVSVLSYVLGRRFGVYAEQLAAPSESPAHAGAALVSFLQSHRVAEAVESPWPFVVSPAATLPELVAQMPAGARPVFGVVQDGRLLGVFSTAQVAEAIDLADPGRGIIAADLMSEVLPLTEQSDLYGTLERFRGEAVDALPVIDPRHRTLTGMVTRAGVMRVMRAALAQRREHLLREHEGFAALDQQGQIDELLSNLTPHAQEQVHRMPVPEGAAGQSLRQLDFRRRYGSQVLAVECHGGELQAPPDPLRPLEPGDVLVVLSVGESRPASVAASPGAAADRAARAG